MKKITSFFTMALMFVCTISKAQTTAMDFNRKDCNGNTQHLFAQLDNNDVAVLEFFMDNCSSCIVAGNKIKPMYDALAAQHVGKMHAYSIAYNNTYSCTTVSNWVTSNGFTTIPMDSGATQVAYYGGFGMPTVVVVAGTNHDVLFSTVGFSTSDTATMAAAIKNFFATTAIETLPQNVTSFTAFPNPTSSNLTVELSLKEAAWVSFELTNLAGQVVKNITAEKRVSGTFSQNISTEALSNGLYVLTATVNGFSTSRKVSVIH
jgi:hypothetical protein